MPSSLITMLRVPAGPGPPSTTTRTWVARECLATLVSASATVKYATASTAGRRPDRHVHLEGNRHGAAGGQAGQRRVEAAVGKHRRVHAPYQVTELDEGGLGLGVRLVDEGGRGVNVVGELRLRPAELHRQGDEALLRAVVQVTLDPAALGLGRVHDALPADLKLGDPRLELRVARRGQQPAGEGGVGGRRGHGSAAGRRAALSDR